MEDTSTPPFPPEIECIIFEIVARSARSSALERINLLLVSKRTQCWVEPILYETLQYIGTTFQSANEGSHIPRPCPPVPLSKLHLVRHLSLEVIDNAPVSFSESTLRACCQITTLALWSGKHADFVFNFILDGNLPLLKRLSTWFYKISPDRLNGPDALRHLRALEITHLELAGPLLEVGMCSFLSYIPNLTHLGFFTSRGTAPAVFNNILSSPLASRLIVLLSTRCVVGNVPRRECLEKYEEFGIRDIRFVCLSYVWKGLIKDRLRALDGSDVGMWEFAEEIIEERKRKIRLEEAGQSRAAVASVEVGRML